MMQPDYEIIQLKSNLFLVRWNTTPAIDAPSEVRYIEEVQALLDAANEPIYFISDLRRGKIRNARTLQKLGELATHRNIGGSTAFSGDPVTKLMMSVFKSQTRRARVEVENQTWETPEDAIAYLERLKAGLTADVDWAAALNQSSE